MHCCSSMYFPQYYIYCCLQYSVRDYHIFSCYLCIMGVKVININNLTTLPNYLNENVEELKQRVLKYEGKDIIGIAVFMSWKMLFLYHYQLGKV